MLLRTRFYIPPLRKQSVIRHALIDRLKDSSGGQLIMVSAPAGYGKTTLVSQWLHTTPHTFCWLTLDPSQSSPELFWQQLIRALQNVQPNLGEGALDLLNQSHNIAIEPVVISLLNDLDELCTGNTSQNPITLVLDDFHRIETLSILQSMSIFLDHLPPSVRVVLTSRQEPPLALARRRANNQLIEISEQDLAFNYDEGHQFFNGTMNLNLDTPDIQLLFAKSEGWIVGLQLAALSLQQNPTAPLENLSLNRHISDYLFDEVFSLQTEELQSFMITTACVPRFCAGLCNELTTNKHSLGVIAQLDQLNLFLVPLDNHRTWFRYHDLFRQFLLQHFSTLPSLKRNEIHQTAANWLENNGYHEDSLEQLATHIASELPLPAHTNQQSPPQPHTPIQRPHPTLIEPLTRRETQVMALVSQGLPNKKIATELNISLNTLKVHIRNLYGKMGVENRTQALLKLNQQSSP